MDPILAISLAAVALVLALVVVVIVRTRSIEEVPQERMARSGADRLGKLSLGRAITQALKRGTVDAQALKDIEDTLLLADVGVSTTAEIIRRVTLKARTESDPAVISAELYAVLLELVDPQMNRELRFAPHDRPTVIMMVGVNGTGKTTTAARLGKFVLDRGRTVLLAAADTFRAAAADQLQTWGERLGVQTVRGAENADPASVAFTAVNQAITESVSTVIVDTAGRLHTKAGLMDELGKVKRVIEKLTPVSETLLVIDATTGQNGLTQARVFAEAVNITGVVLTKLDGTAKGGIVLAVQNELKVPVKFVGTGEGIDDLVPFDPEAFVGALLR